MLTKADVRGFQPDERGPETERIVLVNKAEQLRFYVSVPHGSATQEWLHEKHWEEVSVDYVEPNTRTNPLFRYFQTKLAKGPDFQPVISQKLVAFPDGPNA